MRPAGAEPGRFVKHIFSTGMSDGLGRRTKEGRCLVRASNSTGSAEYAPFRSLSAPPGRVEIARYLNAAAIAPGQNVKLRQNSCVEPIVLSHSPYQPTQALKQMIVAGRLGDLPIDGDQWGRVTDLEIDRQPHVPS